MSNKTRKVPFLDLCRNAFENRWCTKQFCTTCGGQDFRDGLKTAGFDNSADLALAMTGVNLDELLSIHGWDGCVEFCLTLIEPEIRARLLDSWFERLGDRVRIADLILFRFLRFALEKDALADRWSDYCLELATKSADQSLIETLLIVRPEKARGRPEFVGVAKSVANHSTKVAKLLNKLGV